MKWQDTRILFAELFNATRDGVVFVDTDGTIQMLNPAMERMIGHAAADVIGKTCTVLDCDACELIRSETEDKWCMLFQREQIADKRCTITAKNGAFISALKNATVVKDRSGRVVGALEIYTDITELEKRDIRIQELTRIVNNETGFHGMIGMSPAMQNIFQLIEKAAQSDATVLITGESGTGKDLVARAIHETGSRSQGSFVKINCAALSESLIESELFGHAKGAFTGAVKHRKGLFEVGDGGDIFLDEIGDVSTAMQVKLLRVLETKQFMRVGDSRTIDIDARFIVATNKDMMRLIRSGEFREDLFFRINVFPIHLPTLRERKEDIALLVNAFVHELRRTSGKQISGLSPAALEVFLQYRWPGNVRELKASLDYAFAIGNSGIIDVHHLPQQLQVFAAGLQQPHPASPRPSAGEDDRREKTELIAALQQAKGNQSAAARILKVHRMTVFNRMRKYGIRSNEF